MKSKKKKKKTTKKNPVVDDILKVEDERLQECYEVIDQLSDREAIARQETVMTDGIILTIGVRKDEDGHYVARDMMRTDNELVSGPTMAEAVEPVLWKHIYHRMATDEYVTRYVKGSKDAIRSD